YSVLSQESAPSVDITVYVYHTATDGTDPQLITSASTTIDANTADPLAFDLGNDPVGQAFTSADPRRLRVHIDVTAISGGASFTLAYDSSADTSSLDTPSMVVPDYSLFLLAIVIFIPIVMNLFIKRRRLALRIVSSVISLMVVLTILGQQVIPVSAAPDTLYLRDTTINGASPAGEDMNITQGSSEDTLLFDEVNDEAYWYTELTYPTGGDDASIVAGDYLLKMYFSQLPTIPADWYNADWFYRKEITIDNTQVIGASDHSNFPVLVNLSSDTDLAADAQPDFD
ncbi:unnamed protein product, partial [marine sediment metagenome]